MKIDMIVGRNVMALRDAAGKTISETSKEIGVTEGELKSIERGEVRPSPEVLSSIAKFLHVTLVEIFQDQSS